MFETAYGKHYEYCCAFVFCLYVGNYDDMELYLLATCVIFVNLISSKVRSTACRINLKALGADLLQFYTSAALHCS